MGKLVTPCPRHRSFIMNGRRFEQDVHDDDARAYNGAIVTEQSHRRAAFKDRAAGVRPLMTVDCDECRKALA